MFNKYSNKYIRKGIVILCISLEIENIHFIVIGMLGTHLMFLQKIVQGIIQSNALLGLVNLYASRFNNSRTPTTC